MKLINDLQCKAHTLQAVVAAVLLISLKYSCYCHHSIILRSLDRRLKCLECGITVKSWPKMKLGATNVKPHLNVKMPAPLELTSFAALAWN